MMISSGSGSAPFCSDADAFMTPWKAIYPIEIFPTLWSEVASRKDRIVFLKPIYNEIEPGGGGLKDWLESNHFSPTDANSTDVSMLSVDLEREYRAGASSQVSQPSKGVSVNDLRLIAYAKVHEKTVVTLEARQTELPKEKRKYRIPAVCEEKGVPCINFVEMLRELRISI